MKFEVDRGRRGRERIRSEDNLWGRWKTSTANNTGNTAPDRSAKRRCHVLFITSTSTDFSRKNAKNLFSENQAAAPFRLLTQSGKTFNEQYFWKLRIFPALSPLPLPPPDFPTLESDRFTLRWVTGCNFIPGMFWKNHLKFSLKLIYNTARLTAGDARTFSEETKFFRPFPWVPYFICSFIFRQDSQVK